MTAQDLVKIALDQNLLIVAAGSKVIRLIPPLVIKEKEVGQLLNKLNKTFRLIAN